MELNVSKFTIYSRMFLYVISLSRYLQGGVSDAVTSLDGTQLDCDLKHYEETLKSNRLNLFSKHFMDGDKRSDVSIQTLFVTAEERAVAEDIKNSTKDEILRICTTDF